MQPEATLGSSPRFGSCYCSSPWHALTRTLWRFSRPRSRSSPLSSPSMPRLSWAQSRRPPRTRSPMCCPVRVPDERVAAPGDGRDPLAARAPKGRPVRATASGPHVFRASRRSDADRRTSDHAKVQCGMVGQPAQCGCDCPAWFAPYLVAVGQGGGEDAPTRRSSGTSAFDRGKLVMYPSETKDRKSVV